MSTHKIVAFGVLVAWLANAGSSLSADHAIFRAVRDGNIPLLRSVLREGAPPDVMLDDGTTPLMVASLHGTVEAVLLLLEHGADPNLANKEGITPIIWCAGNAEKLAALLKYGANVNAKTAFGNTPLMVAAAFPVVRRTSPNCSTMVLICMRNRIATERR